MSDPKENDFYNLLKDTSDRIMELVKKNGEMSGDIKVLNKSIERLEERQGELTSENRRVIETLHKAMTPDRCAHFHDDLSKRIEDCVGKKCDDLHTKLEKRIVGNLKDDVKGWAKIAFTTLKFIALAAAIFGGSAVGAQALGWIKVLKP